MLALLSSILMVVTTVIPLIFTAVKFAPRLWKMLKFLFGFAGAGGTFVLRNVWWGVFMSLFTFVGGFIFFISIYMGWGLEYYLKFFDFIFTPFALITEELIKRFIQVLPNLPANTSSVLCLFNFGSAFTFLVMGFGFEVYLRILIYFLVRRGK